MKILWLWEREVLKKLKKILIQLYVWLVQTVQVALMRLASVKMNMAYPFFLLLSRKRDLAIPVISSPWQPNIYHHRHFCDNFILASFSDVLYSIGTTSNRIEAAPWLL